jgi:ubiquinone/menaquinone biosynthesis C-methylase UbiE
MNRMGRMRGMRAIVGAMSVCLVACLFVPLHLLDSADLSAASGQTRPRGRLFPPQDLGLLEAPDREQWQRPDQIMDALGIADGSVVADLGAAGGWFTIRLARRVGPNGRVYAEDIQPQMIDAIGRRVQREGFLNVRTVLGTPNDPRLPPGIDAILIVDAYSEIADPVALLKNAAQSLKPQGRLGVVDFLPGGGGPGPEADERTTPDAVIKAAAAAGLRLTLREIVPPFEFLLVFEKAVISSRVSQ